MSAQKDKEGNAKRMDKHVEKVFHAYDSIEHLASMALCK
jgi:hypothetical protein